MLGFGAV